MREKQKPRGDDTWEKKHKTLWNSPDGREMEGDRGE